jgi:hypothetical protein
MKMQLGSSEAGQMTLGQYRVRVAQAGKTTSAARTISKISFQGHGIPI